MHQPLTLRKCLYCWLRKGIGGSKPQILLHIWWDGIANFSGYFHCMDQLFTKTRKISSSHTKVQGNATFILQKLHSICNFSRISQVTWKWSGHMLHNYTIVLFCKYVYRVVMDNGTWNISVFTAKYQQRTTLKSCLNSGCTYNDSGSIITAQTVPKVSYFTVILHKQT